MGLFLNFNGVMICNKVELDEIDWLVWCIYMGFDYMFYIFICFLIRGDIIMKILVLVMFIEYEMLLYVCDYC